MKKIKRNRTTKFVLYAFLALGTLAITGCNKDKNQNGQEIPTGKNKIVVRVAGISDGESVATPGTKSSSSKMATTPAHTIELVQTNDFDAIIALDNKSITNASTIGGLKATGGSRAASTAMNPGNTYNLYFYLEQAGTYTLAKVTPLTAGTETTVELENGNYKWVALSYNNTATLPDGNTNSVTLPENTDVLYASSNLTIGGPEVAAIDITFNRVFARIAVEVNTLGIFGPMELTPTISVTGDKVLKTGTIDLTTGEFIGSLTTGTDLALTSTDFTDIDPVGTDAYQKVAYFYTAGQPAKDLTLTLSDLTIKLDDATKRYFFLSTLTQSKSITPERGKNHRFMVGITESALTLGTTKWARSNLFYRTTDVLGAITPYRFYANNPYLPNQQESFFSFKGHFPGRLASANPANQKDPCALVYPAGLWKTPSQAEISPLTSNQGLLDGALGSVLDLLGTMPATPGSNYGTIYIEYPITAGFNPAYGGTTSRSNRVRLYYNGVQNNVILANGLINLSVIEGGKTAGIWTSDRVLDGGLLDQLSTGVGAWGYLGSTKSQSLFQPQRAIATKSAGLLNIDLLGLGLIGSGFMNVRCVRDASWSTASASPTYNPYPVL